MSQLEVVTGRLRNRSLQMARVSGCDAPGVPAGGHTHVTIQRNEHEYGGAELGVPAPRLGADRHPEATTRAIYRETGSLRVERFNLRLSSSAEPHA
jgi:hypothetical protein